MQITADSAEKVAENSWLKLVGRTVMLLMVPAFVWAWSWGTANTEAIAEIDKRVARIEDNQEDLEKLNKLGREERLKFQDSILMRLDAILSQVAATNERLARLEAQAELRRPVK